MFDDVEQEVVPTSIAFSDVAVEVNYFEKKDQSPKAGLMKTLVVERATFSELVNSIIDDVSELIDRGLLEIRNPAQSLDPRKRVGQKRAPVEEDDSE